MSPSERLNAILLIGLVVAFASGFLVGRSGSDVSPIPANFDPAKADMAASLRACHETLALVVRAAPVSH